MVEKKTFETDFLVIGSGFAGLTAALKAAEAGSSVIVLTKRELAECNSTYAQGGISCVMTEDDSFDLHLEDTLVAGAGLCDSDMARKIIAQGPGRIRDLVDYGVHFTRRGEVENLSEDSKDSQKLDLGKEGGHSKRRVLHSGDITGREVENVLIRRCKAHENITLIEYAMAVDLISSIRIGFMGPNRCLGVYALNCQSNRVFKVLAKQTILATGGAGKVYLYTTNPDIASGDGIAMGYRAFCEISNMEFFQFHPTCLYHPKIKNFLISEAVRGEGGVLKVRDNGEMVPFMDEYHERKSLAPRDIVARAIDKELKKGGEKCVYLDITHHSEEYLRKRFPNIFAKCLELGINMAVDMIPVVPAAHYCCGGITTDINGCTGVENLYAIGETACTGLHGANRLASNSLLEALVMADNSVRHALENCDRTTSTEGWDQVPDWNSADAVDSDEQVVITHNWEEIRQFMWDYVGIFRTTKRLERAKNRARNIRREIEQYYWNVTITSDLLELRNLASVAELIIDSAMQRKESRGLHFNADFPQCSTPDSAAPTILKRKEY